MKHFLRQIFSLFLAVASMMSIERSNTVYFLNSIKSFLEVNEKFTDVEGSNELSKTETESEKEMSEKELVLDTLNLLINLGVNGDLALLDERLLKHLPSFYSKIITKEKDPPPKGVFSC